MNFNFKKMQKKYAKEILKWHYDGKYSFYDMEFDKEDLEDFLEIIENDNWDNYYVAVDEEENLIGMFTYNFNMDVMEIGLGLKPSLTGKGIGEHYVKAGIEYGLLELGFEGKQIKLSVANFNNRAIKVYKKIGFKEVGRYIQTINDEKYEFITMIKNV